MDTVQGIFSLGMSMGQAPKQLQKELHRLKLKLPAAHLLIRSSEWVMFKDKNLEALVLQLKYATYDAEDLLRQFEDQALRQKIEDADRCWTGQTLSSCLNNANHFVLGTNESIRDAQKNLDNVIASVKKVLRLMGLDRVEPMQFMPTTTEIITASQVYGRDTERDQLMEMLGVTANIDRVDEINQVVKQFGMKLNIGGTSAGPKGQSKAAASHNSTYRSPKRLKIDGSSTAGVAKTTNSTCNVSVLPIFGIGGMGKTTLAQLIYNDERVTAHFTVRIWVCVSDLFDIERMTKEIVKTISPNHDLSCDFGRLQVQLREMLKSRKFVLVLDDIWQITEDQWESFNKPLRNGLEGSMILVTTRHKNIASLVATSNCNPVQLKGLPEDIFWEFFKKCAFGKECPDSYPHLKKIGRSISSKLCGTPLAAKTLGRLLNSNLTEQHWMTIKDSELWDQEQKEGDILPALRLSYLHLPTELRRCFAFCSIFPKDYSFRRQEIVDIWVAEGFVAPLASMCIEDVGIKCLDILRERCLFQADPMFPNEDRYVMHDLIHDTAQYVSMHECFSMKDSSEVKHEVRHVSVEMDVQSLSTMTIIPHLNKLRSLRFGTKLDAQVSWFSQLSNILFLSLRGCKLESLPQSICKLNSIRYLDISNSCVNELPEKFWCLYNLQVIDARGSKLKTIHQDVTKLTNLRQLALPEKASLALSKVRMLGNLSCLRNLSYFTIAKRKAAIGELKGMNQLRGTLQIRSIHTVKIKEEAVAARLIDKKYLKALELNWRINPSSCKLSPSENEVVDGLCPNETIERLGVHGFGGDRLPSWLNPIDLQKLRKLRLSSCPFFETLSLPYFTGGTQGGSMGQHASSSTHYRNGISSIAFMHLTSINIFNCKGLKNIDQFLSPKSLPSVETIHLQLCGNLESITADSFLGFVHLRNLTIQGCPNLECPQTQDMVFPHSLQLLVIWNCGQLDKLFPSCLENLTSLTVLYLSVCKNVELIPLDSIPCRNKLKFLSLESCPKLSSIGGSGVVPSSIKYVKIYKCDKLTQVSQAYKRNALSTEELNKIECFFYSFLEK